MPLVLGHHINERSKPFGNPKRKKQWLGRGQEPELAPKPDIHGRKAIPCIWCSHKGNVHFDMLDYDQTVTAKLYLQQLTYVNLQLCLQEWIS
ncbi:transposase, partial [Teladorsagia circumcincta]